MRMKDNGQVMKIWEVKEEKDDKKELRDQYNTTPRRKKNIPKRNERWNKKRETRRSGTNLAIIRK